MGFKDKIEVVAIMEIIIIHRRIEGIKTEDGIIIAKVIHTAIMVEMTEDMQMMATTTGTVIAEIILVGGKGRMTEIQFVMENVRIQNFQF